MMVSAFRGLGDSHGAVLAPHRGPGPGPDRGLRDWDGAPGGSGLGSAPRLGAPALSLPGPPNPSRPVPGPGPRSRPRSPARSRFPFPVAGSARGPPEVTRCGRAPGMAAAEPGMKQFNGGGGAAPDAERGRFPHCVVWTPIPVLT